MNNGTFLGMRIVDMYLYYDMPLLFSCISDSGKLFFVNLVGGGVVRFPEAGTIRPDFDNWYMVAVSEGKLGNMVAGKIDIKTAFTSASDGFIYKVDDYYGRDEVVVSKIDVDDIDLSLIANEGVMLIDG